MSNRTGKREREARNRHKRGYLSGVTQTGTAVRPLKLGRKKRAAFYRSLHLDVRSSLDAPELWLHWSRKDMTAVPVAEPERRMVEPKEPDRLAVNPSTSSGDET